MFIDPRDKILMCRVIGLPATYATSEHIILAHTRRTLQSLENHPDYDWINIWIRDCYVLLTHSLKGQVIQPFSPFKIHLLSKLFLVCHDAMHNEYPARWPIALPPYEEKYQQLVPTIHWYAIERE